MRPGTPPNVSNAPAVTASSTPSVRATHSAASAFATLKRPGKRMRKRRPSTANVEPSGRVSSAVATHLRAVPETVRHDGPPERAQLGGEARARSVVGARARDSSQRSNSDRFAAA